MEKRVVFQNRWLPYLLVAPQLAITLIFFFLPAGQHDRKYQANSPFQYSFLSSIMYHKQGLRLQFSR